MIPVLMAVAGVLSVLSSVNSLANTPPPAASDPAPPTPAAGSAAAANFSDTLQAALNRVDTTLAAADQKAKAYASGDRSVSLSDVMVSLEQANLALQAATALRDKVVAAYSNVMNMPV
jgi:flagellar hook-basal body complex protein FliE